MGIEYYDNHLQIKSRKEIALELPLWGGFYAGSDGYYLVEGQSNTTEDDTAEVIRVIAMTKTGNEMAQLLLQVIPIFLVGKSVTHLITAVWK
mgnify:CR=1 FL=1